MRYSEPVTAASPRDAAAPCPAGAGRELLAFFEMGVTVEIPDSLAARLTAAVRVRGVSVDAFVAEVLAERLNPVDSPMDALAAFIGSMDSGDPEWASTGVAELRQRARSDS